MGFRLGIEAASVRFNETHIVEGLLFAPRTLDRWRPWGIVGNMNVGGSNRLMWACLLACAAMTSAATAFPSVDSTDTDANPYLIICQRNVFRLGTPPPLKPADEKPPDVPKVMLTGFVETAHVTKVLLAKLPDKGSTNATTYLSLIAGERKDDVEVVSIRPQKEEVDIINSGIPMTLCAASNSFAGTGFASKIPGGTGTMAALAGLSRMRGTPAGGNFAGNAPNGSSSFGSGNGSSVIMAGGTGFWRPPTTGGGPGGPGSPGSFSGGLPGSGAGTGISDATAFGGGSGMNGTGSVTSANGEKIPTSLSEAEMRKYMAGLAGQGLK
jgi:hypothetical protein